ncbi:subtilisin-like protease Pr1A [Cordyceps javanica]|uniref:Subtilisin-like protease Pr1A n=1 Tax=Cordyceps javanica TaxID=43265 RepID=A0A545WBG6_9HYPO|nr:subtilisin-like protease Pr1A [Cordyceps javanica]TQW11308.1 subtilisin-like protease Pr1A [Cordyceps javanica]
MRLASVMAILPLLALASPIAETRTEPAPLYLHEPEHSLVARGGSDKFIIKFKGDSPSYTLDLVLERVKHENVVHHYKDGFLGLTAQLDRATVEDLRMIPGVEYIEQDSVGSIAGFKTQPSAPWGLSRISHREPDSEGYVYDEAAGEGVCVYITDSGIDVDHPDFGTRARRGRSFVDDSKIDDEGHGTHCAGIVGSTSCGVAKQAELIGVKVIRKDGTFKFSDLIAAYNWIKDDVGWRKCENGVVVSSSLGGNFSQSLNDAADSLVDRGFFVAVSAGNNNSDVSQFSPASAPKVCTVGGTQSDDKRYTQSNWGPLIDVNAPAVHVRSTVPGGKWDYYTGTSMAAPHVAGLAAYLATKMGVKVTPDLCQTIVRMSTKNAITDQMPNTVNNIAYNGNPT